MPHTKSTKKRVKTNDERRQRNAARRTRMRHSLRDTRKLIQGAEAPLDATQQQTVVGTVSLLDRMVKKGLIHQNKAARLKSRLTRQAQSTGN